MNINILWQECKPHSGESCTGGTVRNWEFGVSLWGTSGEIPGLRDVAIMCVFRGVIDATGPLLLRGKLRL